MIENLVPLAYFKREPFYGSHKGMQYRVVKEEEELQVSVYPEPYNFKTTSDDKKEFKNFPFTNEGREEALSWLNEKYQQHQEIWENSPRW